MRLSHSSDCSEQVRGDIRALCDHAFDGDFSDTDFDHALGGMHILVYAADDASTLAGHAAVVQRSLILGDTPCRAGYVEAVAVDSAHRRQGIGALLMGEVERIVDAAYDLGALGASDVGMSMYRGRGWRPWRGPLAALEPGGRIPTPDDEGAILVWGVDDAELDSQLTCDPRIGALW